MGHNPMLLKNSYEFTLKAITAIPLFFICSTVLADSVGCDDAYVQLDTAVLVINVEPTGVDDTNNIQCALDAAIATNIPTVRLGKHTYNISNLLVENFKGTFEGTSISSTTIQVIDRSVDCAAFVFSNTYSSAIKFSNGEPRIRYMTILADDPCVESEFIFSLLMFTGRPATDPVCGNDVIFGVVDRIKLVEFATDRVTRPIAVFTDSLVLGDGCINNLLGTFKLNRSEIIARRGVLLGMKSGAQVDINFNKFSMRNGLAVEIVDANQSTTIFSNEFKFVKDKLDGIAFSLISVTARTENAMTPAFNRVVIHKNKFDVSEALRGEIIRVRSDYLPKKITTLITDNILLVGAEPEGLDLLFVHASGKGVSKGLVSGNALGEIRAGIRLEGSVGWTIVENSGFANTSSPPDIELGVATSTCIVGPGQNATVDDFGTGNFIL